MLLTLGESSGRLVYPAEDGGMTGLCSTVKKRIAPARTPQAPERKAVLRHPFLFVFVGSGVRVSCKQQQGLRWSWRRF